ncbi:hypothetical protein CAL29_30070 [Bordetella genomosp. 10]|uniref:IclR family transcriptional regulator n=1 Tax=Bordetella genomosp. 10 TaxID=1416804 RepID=A0A261S6M4_9BORD|nr:IclR family transcriptional regulator [Bordetella genomosp. 10]OZI32083.1 hypothetical protein CAL29_30070 [Bordetella genomosp. 10]
MKSDSPSLQAIQRINAVLRVLASHNRTGLRLVDVISASQIDRSTVHRLLQSLVTEGLVAQDQRSKRYFLGMGIFEMAVAIPAQRLRDACLPHLRDLALSTGDTVFLSVRSSYFDGVCIHREEGSFPIARVLEAGRRRPLCMGSSNLAILSRLPLGEIQRICEENYPRIRKSYPGVTERGIKQRLAAAQRDGYVFADVMQREQIIKSMAFPILDRHALPVASIGLSALVERWTSRRIRQVQRQMEAAAASIAHDLDEIKQGSPGL